MHLLEIIVKEKEGIQLLNEFFSLRYTDGISKIDVFNERLQVLKDTTLSITEEVVKMPSKLRIKQLNFLDLFDQYKFDPIRQNNMVHEDIVTEYKVAMSSTLVC